MEIQPETSWEQGGLPFSESDIFNEVEETTPTPMNPEQEDSVPPEAKRSEHATEGDNTSVVESPIPSKETGSSKIWTDSEGRIHMGSEAPEGVEARDAKDIKLMFENEPK